MDYIKYIRKYMGHRPVILNGTSVLVLDKENRVLLQKRTYPDKIWGLPGGIMEMGESLEETGIREVYEETGLHIKNLQLLDIYSGKEFYKKLPNEDEFYLVNMVYYTHDYEGDMVVNENEGLELRFFSLMELPEEMVGSHRRFINDFIKKFHSILKYC